MQSRPFKIITGAVQMQNTLVYQVKRKFVQRIASRITKTHLRKTVAQPREKVWLNIDSCIKVVLACHKWLACHLSILGTHDLRLSSTSRTFWADK